MSRHRLSASRAELAEKCLFWARPDVDLGPGAPMGVAPRLGSALHQGAETAAPGEAEPADLDEEDLGDVLRSAAALPTADLDAIAARWGLTPSSREALGELFSAWAEWWPGFLAGRGGTVEVRREVPFAWNTRTWTARELPSSGHRDYSSALPEEVTCTIDAVIVEYATAETMKARPPLRVTVVDLKTGRARHRPAAEHAQLAVGALCAGHVYGVDSVSVVLAHVKPEGVYVDEATLDAWTTAARAELLEQHLAAIPTAAPRPGSHCAALHCPALGVCEGPRALARRAPELAAALTVNIRSNEDAAAALLAVKPIEAFVAQLKRAAVDWAEAHGGRVVMPDGSARERVQVGRRSIDLNNARLRAELERLLGGAEGVEGLVKVKRSLPIAGLEKAVKARAGRGKKEAALSEALAALEATGGLKETFHGEWRDAEDRDNS